MLERLFNSVLTDANRLCHAIIMAKDCAVSAPAMLRFGTQQPAIQSSARTLTNILDICTVDANGN
jgi:hypothetical protein